MAALIVFICMMAYGVWYTVNPVRFLKRKYMNGEVPETAVKAARIVGVVIVILGAVGIVYSIAGMQSAA